MKTNDSRLIYLLVLCMASNIRFGIIGLQDFVVVIILTIFFVCGRKKIALRSVSLNGMVMFATPIILLSLCIAIKWSFYNERITFESISLLLKLIMIIIYWHVFETLDFRKVDYNWLLIFFSIPLILSIIMYYNPAINRAVLLFYDRSAYPSATRFGGIYGKDVNTTGLYATLVIILSYIFYKSNVIAKGVEIGALIISAVMIILSGMRAGAIALLIAIIVMRYIRFGNTGRIVWARGGTKKLLKTFLSLFLIAIIFYAVTEYALPTDRGAMLQERFSLEHLIGDFDSRDGEGNLAAMMGYFKEVLTKYHHASIVFGYDISFTFVDCFYLELFCKYGLVGILSSIIFLGCCVKKASKLQYKNYALFLILFALIISLKGIFILDTKLIFIFIFILNFLQKQNNSNIYNQHCTGINVC